MTLLSKLSKPWSCSALSRMPKISILMYDAILHNDTGVNSKVPLAYLPPEGGGLRSGAVHHDPCADPAAGAAADRCPAEALFGAPVKPAAAPMPSISSQCGQGFEALPWSARSITRRAIFSTTCSK